MTDAGLALGFLAIAALYAAVGQAGASGYLGLMAFADLPPEVMRPTALALNLVVAGLLAALFRRDGKLTGRVLFSFGVLGAPFSFLGGSSICRRRSSGRRGGGAFLLGPADAAAVAGGRRAPARGSADPAGDGGGRAGRLRLRGDRDRGRGVPRAHHPRHELDPAPPGDGGHGGVQPAERGRRAAGAAATLPDLPPALPLWMAAAAAGGLAGGAIGLRRLSEPAVRRLLAAVLAISGAKLIAG